MELGHFDKHSPTTQERKAPQVKNYRFFRLETLKNCILNEKFYPKVITIRAFFPQIRALFSNFRKRTGQTSSPPPSSYAPVFDTTVSSVKGNIKLQEFKGDLHS